MRTRSLSRTLVPRRSASAAATVDLPVPGSPPTRISRTLSRRSWSSAIPACPRASAVEDSSPCACRDVVEAVEPAQAVVELGAVQHPGAGVEAEDGVGEQIAVPVDDPAVREPPVEQRLASS
ncbi:hypothetical protein ACFWY9_16140 [Amycolatopsis sp. NPDC059027]|uniref:hypothetical protein n=1 Tax=unclassified Amycolatopsis TaxID=2618356 RepID=UPI00366B3D7C